MNDPKPHPVEKCDCADCRVMNEANRLWLLYGEHPSKNAGDFWLGFFVGFILGISASIMVFCK